MTHMMIDMETLGTAPGSAILSIGACVFDPFASTFANTHTASFYANIDPESCREAGLTVDARTEAWWAQQDETARGLLLSDRRPLRQVLESLEQFWHDSRAKYVWSYGANFDVVLIEEAMRRLTSHVNMMRGQVKPGPDVEDKPYAIVPPWGYRDVRCVRTVLAMAGMDMTGRSLGTPHYALDDARSQVAAVRVAFERMHIRPVYHQQRSPVGATVIADPVPPVAKVGDAG